MKAYYVGQAPSGEPGYSVEYIVNKTNKRLVQKFSSFYPISCM